MVKYGESYITTTSSSQVTAKAQYKATTTPYASSKLRTFAYVNASFVILDATDLASTATILVDAIKYRELRTADCIMISYTNIVGSSNNVVRLGTTYPSMSRCAMSVSSSLSIQEFYANIFPMAKMGSNFIDGHVIRFETTDGFVYDPVNKIYSRAKTYGTFKVPFRGNANVSSIASQNISKFERFRNVISDFFGSAEVYAPPYNFTKFEGNILSDVILYAPPFEFTKGESTLDLMFTDEFIGYKLRTDTSTLEGQFGFEGKTSGKFTGIATLEDVFNIEGIPDDFIKFIATLDWLSSITNTQSIRYRLVDLPEYSSVFSKQFDVYKLISSTSTLTNTVSDTFTGYKLRSSTSTLPTTANFGYIYLDGLDTAYTVQVLSSNGTLNVLFDYTADGIGTHMVHWGDGTSDSYAGNAIGSGFNTFVKHTYATPGTYVVRLIKIGTARVARLTLEDSSTVKHVGFEYLNEGMTRLLFGPSSINGPQQTLFTYMPSKLPTTLTQVYLQNCNNFNDPNVTLWNTSNLQRFKFYNCTNFNQNIGVWNTSNIIDMYEAFRGCSNFNQNLNSWDVSNVTFMTGTFQNASSFNQPLNNWNTSKVTTMSAMFSGASSFDQNISNWCVNLIATKPTNFDTNTPSTWITSEKPNWGAPC